VQWLERAHVPSIVLKYSVESRRARIGTNSAFSLVSSVTTRFFTRIIF
jgi:hypothetical protein